MALASGVSVYNAQELSNLINKNKSIAFVYIVNKNTIFIL